MVGRLARSSFGVFALRVGQAAVELVGILYVARSVGAATFGTFSLFIATSVLVSFFTDVGFVEATKKRISEGDSQSTYLYTSLATHLGIFLLVTIAILLFRHSIAAFIGTAIAIPFLVASSLFHVVYRSFSAALFGRKRVVSSVSLVFLESVAKIAVWLVALYLGYELLGLFAGFLAGKVLAAVAGAAMVSLRPVWPSAIELRSLARFAKYSWLGRLKGESWIWTDTLILGVFVASVHIGVYEVSWRISGVFFFFASAMSSTVFPEISELSTKDKTEDIDQLVETALVYTGILAVPGLFGGLVLGDRILAFFGNEYIQGYPLIALLIFARVLHSYEIIFENTINAVDEPALMFRANAVFIALNVVGNVLLISWVGWQGAAIATTFAMLVKTILVYAYASKVVTISAPVKEIALEVLAATVMGVVVMLFPERWTSMAEVSVIVAVGVLSYAAAVVVLVPRIRHRVLRLL